MSTSDATVPGTPTHEPHPWTLDAVKQHLQTACKVELYTIPIYLYALYSIKKSNKDQNVSAAYTIRNVVREEMLHLILAGNTLRAIGGQPILYHPKVVPEYPSTLFKHKTPLNLRPATKSQLGTFMDIERPKPRKPALLQAETLLLEYRSIGDFYEAVIRGLKTVSQFEKDPSEQFTADEYPSFPSEFLVPITNQESALKAMALVIEQGEGHTGTGADGHKSHFQSFTEIHEKDTPDCYPVVENIERDAFKGRDLFLVMEACDCAYSYLLLTIQKCWACKGEERAKLVKNINTLMTEVLKPTAEYLVTQPLTESGNAGPPFNYYDFSPPETPFDHLRRVMGVAAEKHAVMEDVKTTVADLFDIGSV